MKWEDSQTFLRDDFFLINNIILGQDVALWVESNWGISIQFLRKLLDLRRGITLPKLLPLILLFLPNFVSIIDAYARSHIVIWRRKGQYEELLTFYKELIKREQKKTPLNLTEEMSNQSGSGLFNHLTKKKEKK